MEPVVDLVSARQEHSGLQKKVPVPERPSTSFRWASMGPDGDSNVGPQTSTNETRPSREQTRISNFEQTRISDHENNEIRAHNSFLSSDSDLAEIEQQSVNIAGKKSGDPDTGVVWYSNAPILRA